MQYNSYIVSETKTAFSIPMQTPIIKKNLKQKAFTLAETLITLSIIGVVAAMTVPTLVTNAQKASYVAGLKKTYSNLQNASKMIPESEGCAIGDYECAQFNSYGGPTQDENLAKMLSKHFKVVKYNFKYQNTEPACAVHSGSGAPCFQTDDGIIIGSSMGIWADVNGEKGPNKMGRDQFYFYIAGSEKNGVTQGTLLPSGSKIFSNFTGNKNDYWKDSNSCNDKNIKNNSGNTSVIPHSKASQCTGRVLEEGKMDY